MSKHFDYDSDKADDFDITRLNVIKLNKVVDCDIALEECRFRIDMIKADIAAKFGNEKWETAARFALAGFEHKERMVRMKKDALLAEQAAWEKRKADKIARAEKEME